MALPTVKNGDVFSLSLSTGMGIVQCVKEVGDTEMESIRVLPGRI